MAQEKTKTKKDNTKIGAVIILIISAIVFIPFGGYEVMNAFFGKNDAPLFGKYDGKEIRYEAGSTFTRATQNLADRYKSMGYEVGSEAYYYIFNQAFEETVKDMAYLAAVKKSGYTVPDEAVNRRLITYYADETGKYSQRIYNQTDKATRDSVAEGVELTLAYTRYTDDLLGSSLSVNEENLYGVKASSNELKFISDMGRENHTFRVVTFDTEKFPKEEAAKWASSNMEKFVKYNLSVITVDTQSEAETLLKQLNANEITFDDAITEKSQQYYSDAQGKISRPYHYQLEIAIENKDDVSKVTSLSKDQLSPVVKTVRGFSIYRADGTSTPADFTDDETLNVVLTYIKTNEHGYIEDYYTNIANNFIAQSAKTSIDEACEKFGVSYVDTTPFPINYGSSSMYSAAPANLNVLNNLSTNADILQKIFALKENETSAPVLLGSNIAVFKCIGIMNDSTEADTSVLKNRIASANNSTVTNALMTSDKVENNVWQAYFDNFANFGD